MTLAPKALEAVKDVLYEAVKGNLEAGFTVGDVWLAIETYQKIADLVPRSELVNLQNALGCHKQELTRTAKERGEARRKLAEMEIRTDELLVAADAKMYQQGAQVAALREALVIAEMWMMLLTDDVIDGEGKRKNYADATGLVRAALTDTAKAAAQWVLLDDEHVVVSLSAVHGAVKLGRDFYKNCGTSPCLYPDWLRELGVFVDNARAAAPQAGEPEDEG
ncbi:MAG TPA: hypothetical protein ENH62_02425 [Marinobacter sp.]|uniref:Uncharacterized protein n=1 Tax=marine sediment metagenome TaxID=412755 RepID=A0A0F9NCC8_9ZZZZ|nr:hypothetical protein [Marinobacter sp.]